MLTSLSFQRPGMQKDSNRSLPHRSKMRNSEGRGQAGRERRTLSKPSGVYCTQTNRKESEDTMAVTSRPHATHQSPRTSSPCPGWHFHLTGTQTAQNSSATQCRHVITACFVSCLTDEGEAVDVRTDAAHLPQVLAELPPEFD